MKRFFYLLAILTPAAATGEVPESIVGTWHFDMPRTLSEHFGPSTTAFSSSPISVGSAEVQEAPPSDVVDQPSSSLTLTITEETIVSTSSYAEPSIASYQVIGGNSRLVIVECTDDEGFESVVNIRLVEDGIAVETMNCRESPKQCERARRSMVEPSKKQHEMDPSMDPGALAAVGASAEAKPEGSDLSRQRVEFSQPRWVYFGRGNDE